MTYGPDRRLPSETAHADACQSRIRVGSAVWRQLGPQCRLRLIERELRPANDLADGYPAAL